MALYSKKWWYPTGEDAASVRAIVFLEDNATLAPIFADPALTFPIANPTTTSPAGQLTFYADDGRYWVYVGDDFSGDAELATVSPFVTGAVLSVNGQTGIVILDASDVDAQPITAIQAKGDLYVGVSNDNTTNLPVGIDGQFLSADSGAVEGVSWASPPSSAVTSVNSQTGDVVLTASDVQAQPANTIESKGDLYVGIADDITTNLPVGIDGQFLTADSGAVEGISWTSPPASPVVSVNGQTGAVILTASDVEAVPTGRAINTVNGLQGGGTLDSDLTLEPIYGTTANTVAEGNDPRIDGAIQSNIFDAKGDLISATADDSPVRLPVGSDGLFLRADSSQLSGLAWASAAVTGTGDVIGPASSTDNGVTRFDGITGKLIQDSLVTLSDDGTYNLPSQLGPFPDFEGDLYLDGNTHALSFHNGTLALPIGQKSLLLVHNSSGGILSAGMPVYITGHIEAFPYPPTVEPALADAAVTARAVGLVSGIIADGDDGYVVTNGIMSPYPTVGFSEGDYLYVSPSVAGALTNVKPGPPDFATCVGVVSVADISHGSITVFRTEAAVDLTTGDVVGPASATDNALPRYDGVSGKLIKDSPVTVSDTGSVVLPGQGFPPPYTDGQLYYDSNYHTLTFDNDDPNVVLHVGTQTRLRVLNSSGSSISYGSAVYVTGDSGVFPYPPTVDLAIATTEPQSHAVGIMAETVADGDEGYAIIEGLLYAFPTVAYNEGDYLYVSDSVPGGLTNVRPSAPNFATCVAMVSAVDLVHGTLSVMRTEASLGFGAANQVRGINAAGTAEEYKTLTGTAGRLTVTQGIGSATFDVSSTLSDSKIDKATLTAKGSLISATGAATPVDLPVGTNNQLLRANSATASGLEWATTGTGDVVGPASATDNALARFDTTTGKLIQTSVVPLSDTGVFTIPAAATPTAANGNLYYSTTGGNALNFQNQEFADVTQQLGRQVWLEGRNASGFTITKGQAVYINGAAVGGVPAIVRAQANADVTSRAVGLAVHDIENASTGYVCVSGMVFNVNTTGFANGDTLYLSSTVAGGLQNTKPALPNFVVKIGQVGQPGSAGAGNILVQPSPLSGDVFGPTSSTDNGIPRYDGTTGKIIQGSGFTISDLDNLAFPNGTPGTLNALWRSGDDLIYQTSNVNYSIAIGQQEFTKVNNVTGSTILKGSAVYILNPANSSPPNVALAIASAAASSQAIGVAAHDIADLTTGYISTSGLAGGVNTAAFSPGDVLYLSASVAGGLTNVKPVAPNFITRIGIANFAFAGGNIHVSVDGPILGTGTNGQMEVSRSTAPGGTARVFPSSTAVFPGNGLYVPAGGAVVVRTSHATVLNTMYLLPFAIMADETLASVQMEVTGASATAVARIGVYASSATTFQPTGSPVADFGTVSVASSGLVTLVTSQALTAGVWYLALASQTVAANMRFGSGFTPYVQTTALPTGSGAGWNNCWTQTGVSGALPAISIASTAEAPVIGLLF